MMTMDYTFERRLEFQCEEAMEKGVQQGRAEGIQEGRKEGVRNKLNELIRKKLLKRKSLEQIAEELEEDPDELRSLYEQIQKELAVDSFFSVGYNE